MKRQLDLFRTYFAFEIIEDVFKNKANFALKRSYWGKFGDFKVNTN